MIYNNYEAYIDFNGYEKSHKHILELPQLSAISQILGEVLLDDDSGDELLDYLIHKHFDAIGDMDMGMFDIGCNELQMITEQLDIILGNAVSRNKHTRVLIDRFDNHEDVFTLTLREML